jgi:hypothetical protein
MLPSGAPLRNQYSIVNRFRQTGPAHRRAAKRLQMKPSFLLYFQAIEILFQILYAFPHTLVEMTGLEPVTSALQRRRSPN